MDSLELVWGTYYSVRKEKEWSVHLEDRREKRTYDLIVDMIAIYQHHPDIL